MDRAGHRVRDIRKMCRKRAGTTARSLPKLSGCLQEWLVGGGAMGELIRTTDWSVTPFGPRPLWPATLRTVVNVMVASPFPMALLWGRKLLLIYNDAYAMIAGDKHPHALGRSSREVWPEVWHINEPIFAEVLQRGVSLSFENKPFRLLRHGFWETAYFTLAYSPVRLTQGEVGGALVVLQETTPMVLHQRQLVAEKKRLHVVLETLPVGLWITDTAGQVEQVNAAGQALCGAGAAVLHSDLLACAHGHLFWPYTGEPVQIGDTPLAHALRGETPTPVMFDCDQGNGRRGTHVACAAPIRGEGGALVGAVAVVQNVTDLENLKKAAKEYAANNALLREALQRKDDFLALLSHELRNPLAPIRCSLAILRQAPLGSAPAQRAQEIMERQVGHMARLLDDLLDVTRLTQGTTQLVQERLDFNELVQQVVTDHDELFRSSRVALLFRPAAQPVWVWADRTRMAQVVSNLLQNAVKFTPSGGTTTVTLEAADGGPTVQLHVQDTGRGITADVAGALFQPLHQPVRLMVRGVGGLGLGLALVKRLVELHGGRASVMSDGLGKGARFTITLPRHESGDVCACMGVRAGGA